MSSSTVRGCPICRGVKSHKMDCQNALYVAEKDRENGKLKAQCELFQHVLANLESYASNITCTHEETRRGGAIWESCKHCGESWADDRGGKPEFVWDDAILEARTILGINCK